MGEKVEVKGFEKEFLHALHVLNEKQYSKSDRLKAIGSLDRLSAEGHVRSTVLLGIIYNEGYIVDKDLEQAKFYFERSTFLGAVNGEYHLGLLLLGDNQYRNEKEGVKHIYNAAKKGLKEALFTLGEIYLKGIYCEKDVNKAEQYFLQSGVRGYGIAYYELYKLSKDRGDEEKAEEYLQLSKDYGYDVKTGEQNFLKDEYLNNND